MPFGDQLWGSRRKRGGRSKTRLSLGEFAWRMHRAKGRGPVRSERVSRADQRRRGNRENLETEEE